MSTKWKGLKASENEVETFAGDEKLLKIEEEKMKSGKMDFSELS